MLPTIRSVLDVREIRAALPEIVSGADSLDRGVRWVHVSEVREVAGLLQGGELLLSTGLAMSGTEEDAATYISDIIAARAAGLVIELSQRFPAVPERALALGQGCRTARRRRPPTSGPVRAGDRAGAPRDRGGALRPAAIHPGGARDLYGAEPRRCPGAGCRRDHRPDGHLIGRARGSRATRRGIQRDGATRRRPAGGLGPALAADAGDRRDRDQRPGGLGDDTGRRSRPGVGSSGHPECGARPGTDRDAGRACGPGAGAGADDRA